MPITDEHYLETKYYHAESGELRSYGEWCEYLDVDDLNEELAQKILTPMEFDQLTHQWEEVV